MQTLTYSTEARLDPFIPAWLFEHNLSPHEGWILAYLWRCRNAQSGKCNPSASTIARNTGVSTRKVFSCLKALALKGLINVDSGDKNRSNEYQLVLHGVHRVLHGVQTKAINSINTRSSLSVHPVQYPLRDEPLGVLDRPGKRDDYLRSLMPTLSPNAYRDYRVEVLGDGHATVITAYGSRTRYALAR